MEFANSRELVISIFLAGCFGMALYIYTRKSSRFNKFKQLPGNKIFFKMITLSFLF